MAVYPPYGGELLERRGSLPIIWPWRPTIFSFGLFLITLVVYVGLHFGYRPYINSQISEQDAAIAKIAETVPAEDQERFLMFYSQLANLRDILNDHTAVTPLFSWFEKTTNQKVFFGGLTADPKTRAATLDGIADSYEVLSEQLQAFKQSPDVERYSIGQAQSADGRISFGVTLILKKDLFSF